MKTIDTSYNFMNDYSPNRWACNDYADTRAVPDVDRPGKDGSHTLLSFHKIFLEQRINATGKNWEIECVNYIKLHANGKDYLLSSDSMDTIQIYKSSMKSICLEAGKQANIPQKINEMFGVFYTYGNFILFPKENSINRTRGNCCGKIQDRFDLTLECIRRWYNKEVENPLETVLNNNEDFLNLFNGFDDYIKFWCLEDMVENGKVKSYLGGYINQFDKNPLPQSLENWELYIENVTKTIKERNQCIEKKCKI